ncbi:MAG: sulfotransferase [Cyclobacteriaceae bacterium]|nr:sulfotransferase [Cyclobacteriaceae bacterium]
MKDFQTLIIIGAPRSGTNMLRDVICQIPGFGTWPCDEINYIWRHGNITEPTDEYDTALATAAVKDYVRDQFRRLASKQGLNIVVEKTCANSLRVPFVDQVIPNAKYVFIYRDGFDVVDSALNRWKANIDLAYLMRKARYVPISDLPFYASRYFLNRIYRFFSREQRLAFWGPQFHGMYQALDDLSLGEVCALQWQRCVELSSSALDALPKGRVASVRYEDFVNQPLESLNGILDDLDFNVDQDKLKLAVRNVSLNSVGKGRANLSPELEGKIRSLVGETLSKFGYE